MLMVRWLNDRHPATDTVAITPQTVKESVPGLSMAFYGDATTLYLPQGQSHELGSPERFKAPFNELPIFFTPPLGTTWALAGETLAASGYQEKRLAAIGTVELSLTRIKATTRQVYFKENGTGSKLILEGACRFVCTNIQVAPSRLEPHSRNLDPD
jgi:hypothetical protein